MLRTLSTFAFGLAALGLSACGGDFATRKICLPNSDPSCRPDTGNFVIPDRNGPNPNFPDPNVFVGPGRQRLDSAPSKSGVVINELLLDPVGDNAGRQALELWNSSQEAVSLAGCRLVTGGHEFAFSERDSIPAGGLLVLRFGAPAGDGIGQLSVAGISEIDAKSGDLALYGADGAMWDYVQWGAAGSASETAAVAEHQWLSGASCVAPVEGYSLSFKGMGNLTADFTAWYPSLGKLND